jgi:hypothetical protein
MEEKGTKTRKNRSLSKDTPLGEVFSNRIKALDSVFDDGYDLTQNNSDSKSGSSSPATKPSKKKTPASSKK